MQQDNALIGVAIAAYYPDISISGAAGYMGGHAFPINAAHQIWSLGAAAADPLFDGGLRGAEVDAAHATYKQSVANYRQTVLTAFQQVEDQLVALRVQSAELKVQEKAVKAAREAVEVYLNQYRAGTVPFTTVVVAEATLLTDEEAALTTRQNLFVASVTLMEALGGGWNTSQLTPPAELSEAISLLPRY
jgi:outer membrane protein TolC